MYEEDLWRIQYGGAYSYRITSFFSSNVEILLVIDRITFPPFNVCFPFPVGNIKTCTLTYWGIHMHIYTPDILKTQSTIKILKTLHL